MSARITSPRKITPHLGYVSEQNYRKYFPDIVEDIRTWLDGKPVRVIS